MDRATAITASERLAANDDWTLEQRASEIVRLGRVLRYAHLTIDERKIAEDMLSFWLSEKENTNQ